MLPRNIGHWNSRGDRLAGAVLGYLDLGSKRGPADCSQVDAEFTVAARAERPRDALRGFQLEPVALAVINREGVALETAAPSPRETGRRIEPAGEEDNGAIGHGSAFIRRAARPITICGASD